MRIGALAAAVLVVTVAACGQETSSPTTAERSPASDPGETRDTVLTGPPPLTLQRPEGQVDLVAYSWCYHSDGVGGCADGGPPAHLAQTSATDPLAFTFPLEGWAFTASFRERRARAECERIIRVEAVDRSDGTFLVPAVVPTGQWEVEVSGYADGGGSLSTVFGWTTTGDSPVAPVARGEVGFLGPPSVRDDDRALEAYGPSLTLTGLAVEPSSVSAELVLSDAGARATYPMSATQDDACPQDGTISMAGAHPNRPADLPDLGEPPYAYEVLLTLDGSDYVGTGQWPDDLEPAMSNQLALTWSPPLPAWSG